MIMISVYALFLHFSVVKYQCKPYDPTDQCDVGLYEVIIQSLDKAKAEPRPVYKIMAIMKARCVFKKLVGQTTITVGKKTQVIKRYRYTAMYVDTDEDNDNVFMDDTQSQEFHDHRRFEKLEFPVEQTKICKVQ